MSLINQMLKDLARREKPEPRSEIILSGLVIPFSKSKKNKFRQWLVINILLLMLIIISAIFQKYYFAEPEYAASIHFISEPALITKSDSKIIKKSTFASPTLLNGITLDTQKDMTNLRLLLNQNTLYRLTSNDKNQLTIILENTRLTANLPQIETMNSAIKSVRMINQADGSLKLNLTLNEGAELNHLTLAETNNLPELQIDLLYKNELNNSSSNDTIEEQQVSAIKKISYDTSINDEYQEAMRFANEGKNHEALIMLKKFVLKYPAFIPARNSLATLLLKQHHISLAEDVVNIGLEQQPLYLPFIQLKAQILVDKNKIKQALNLLQSSAPSIEENPDYFAFMAALYQRQNQFLIAEKIYERLLTLQPDNATWWLGLAIAYESLNKNSKAVQAYKNANNLDNLSLELKTYAEGRIHALLT